ncbi:MAG: hypothetical protein ACK5V3_17490, partial [Bdellovibrionales bacterium]
SRSFGFWVILAAYWVPTFLVFRLFSQSLLGPHRSPWTRIGWTLVGLPLLATRTLGILSLIPGVSRLVSIKAQEKFQKNVQDWQGRTRFSTFYYGSSSSQYSVESELKDVTPKPKPQPELLG